MEEELGELLTVKLGSPKGAWIFGESIGKSLISVHLYLFFWVQGKPQQRESVIVMKKDVYKIKKYCFGYFRNNKNSFFYFLFLQLTQRSFSLSVLRKKIINLRTQGISTFWYDKITLGSTQSYPLCFFPFLLFFASDWKFREKICFYPETDNYIIQNKKIT
jgi:hypothetical protein